MGVPPFLRYGLFAWAALLMIWLAFVNLFLLVVPIIQERRDLTRPRRALSTSAAVRFLINGYIFYILWTQLRYFSLLLNSGIVTPNKTAEDWVQLFAHLAFAVLFLTVGRAFYVISALDNGFYNLAQRLPTAIGKRGRLRWAEFVVRLLISVVLYLSAGVFFKTDFLHFTPSVHAIHPIIDACSAMPIGTPVHQSFEECVEMEIQSLPSRADAIAAQIANSRYLRGINREDCFAELIGSLIYFPFLYALQILWCIIVIMIEINDSAVTDLKRDTLLQLVVPGFSIVVLLFVFKFLQLGSSASSGFLDTKLLVTAILGVTFAIGLLAFLSYRANEDRKHVWEVIQS